MVDDGRRVSYRLYLGLQMQDLNGLFCSGLGFSEFNLQYAVKRSSSQVLEVINPSNRLLQVDKWSIIQACE